MAAAERNHSDFGLPIIRVLRAPSGVRLPQVLFPRDLLARREKITTLEEIPLRAIRLDEGAIVDTGHAEELRGLMYDSKVGEEPRGQVTPIAVRARVEIGDSGREEVVYDIADGYHRTVAALHEEAREGRDGQSTRTITATVMYGCSDEELFDLRIAAVGSVKSVQFARLIEWMNRSYENSEWAKSGFSMTQIFGVASHAQKGLSREKGKTRSNLLGVSGVELEKVYEWAKAKADKWGRTIDGLHQTLMAVECADPALVREVRSSKGGGKDHQIFITPERLKAVVTAFPGEINYGLQRSILSFAVANKLSAKQTAFLALEAADILTSDMDASTVATYLGKIHIPEEIGLALRGDRTERKTQPLQRRIAELEGEIGDLKDTVVQVTERADAQRRGLAAEYTGKIALLEIELASARTLADEQAQVIASIGSNGGLPSVAQKAVGQASRIADAYKAANDTLVERNKKLAQRVRELEGGQVTSSWWHHASFLTPIQRACMDAVFGEQLPFREAARQLKMSPNAIYKIAGSALVARIEHEDENGKIF